MSSVAPRLEHQDSAQRRTYALSVTVLVVADHDRFATFHSRAQVILRALMGKKDRDRPRKGRAPAVPPGRQLHAGKPARPPRPAQVSRVAMPGKFPSILASVNPLTNPPAWIIAATGCLVFRSGLSNPFQGDDILQIVSNPVVHSITNIGQFFSGGTFYFGQQNIGLAGAYYRPLQTTSYSALYTIFGPNPFFFHAFQMLLCAFSAYLLYGLFKFFIHPRLALFLAMLFLVHPANSQVAFSIPNLQDALFFFFGILALTLLVRYRSIMSLALAVGCLTASLLGKETGIFFVLMALVYLLGWDRHRLYAFLGLILAPIVLYVSLRANAIGWNLNHPGFVGDSFLFPVCAQYSG